MKWPPVAEQEKYDEAWARASGVQASNWNQLSQFERRSCVMKRRYKTEPTLSSMALRAYACGFCGGWHLTSRFKDGADR